MSKAQFGLGFHKGFEEATELERDWQYQIDIGEIYWICGELAERIGKSEDDPLNDMALAKAITHLLTYRARIEREQKQRKEFYSTHEQT